MLAVHSTAKMSSTASASNTMPTAQVAVAHSRAAHQLGDAKPGRARPPNAPDRIRHLLTATTDQTTQANILNESLRLVFGMPDTTGFTMWGFWAGAVWSGCAERCALQPGLVRFAPREPPGTILQSQWTTDLTLEVGPDGTIDFNGFYGDYEVTIGGQTFDLSLVKGTQDYALTVTPGDYNGDGVVDAADFVVLQKYFGQSATLTNRDPCQFRSRFDGRLQ